ncbi:Mur ligase [Suillus clintonianus]|uniref:Mur ligase n=1 Tax=Suillus clintonianus TaxID=1904413 RepID=UPI001B8666E0|nr:Mur ligase [Suillus clintonianus]KAG2151342.1 Mur ligase [Suillus clintonianus]
MSNLSLDRIGRLAPHLPPYSRPTVHVAGTNGKGSVTCILSSIFLASGLTVGRFNSPHLTSVQDSILINEQSISFEEYSLVRAAVQSADQEHGTEITTFEILTLVALQVFEKLRVDVVVVEVGMGGRLDATNIMPDESILLSLLTAVDLDHQTFLGNTVELIAKEKASIARKNKPFVLGIQKHAAVENVVRSVVEQTGGYFIATHLAQRRAWDETIDGPPPPTFSLDAESFSPPPAQPITFTNSVFPNNLSALLYLNGAHQVENLSLVLTVISTLMTHPSCASRMPNDFSERVLENIQAGIRNATWRGRLSFHRLAVSSPIPRVITVLADGAHNRASSETLASYVSNLITMLDGNPQARILRLTYILALSHSPPKTPRDTLSPLFAFRSGIQLSIQTKVAAVRFTSPEGMPWITSVPPSEIAATVRESISGAGLWVASDEGEIQGQLESALEWATAERTEGEDGVHELVVVAGSLYLVADFYRLLARQEANPI